MIFKEKSIGNFRALGLIQAGNLTKKDSYRIIYNLFILSDMNMCAGKYKNGRLPGTTAQTAVCPESKFQD
jgi:hypothetical protein